MEDAATMFFIDILILLLFIGLGGVSLHLLTRKKIKKYEEERKRGETKPPIK